MLDAGERRVQAVARDGLDEEVERLDLEGLDGGVGVAGEEHDLGRVVEAAQQARQLDALDLGHPHVEQEHVEAPLAEAHERLAPAAGGLDAAHARRALEQALHVRQRARLVVHGQHQQSAHVVTSVRGMCRTSSGPAPLTASSRPPSPGRSATASGTGLLPQPLSEHGGDGLLDRPGRDAPADVRGVGQRDRDPVREPRLLQPQERRGVRELLGGADRRGLLAQPVGQELAELGEHVARVVRVLVDVARGRGEHVVDEVRGDRRGALGAAGRRLFGDVDGHASAARTLAPAPARTRRRAARRAHAAAGRMDGLDAGAQLL